MAEAVGIRGIRIEDPAEVEDGIAAALAHDGPVLVDAVVNRTELAMREPGFDHGGSCCIRGMIDAPPASRRGSWCAESGLTKGVAARRFIPCNRVPRRAAGAPAMGQQETRRTRAERDEPLPFFSDRGEARRSRCCCEYV
jgi:hypothetical protein